MELPQIEGIGRDNASIRDRALHSEGLARASLPYVARPPHAFYRTLIRITRLFPEITKKVPLEEVFYPDQNTYRQSSMPYLLQGREDASSVLMVSGLGVTGRSDWKAFADFLHQTTDQSVEVYSLPGHDGYWSSLVSVTANDWYDFFTARAQALAVNGKSPIACVHSTAATAAIVASVRHRREYGEPLFGGIIAVAPPFGLKKFKHSMGLKIVSKPVTEHPAWRGWHNMGAKFDLENVLKINGVNGSLCCCRYLPITALVQMDQTRNQALNSLEELIEPVLFVQGMQDRLVDPNYLKKTASRVGSDDLSLALLDKGRHSCMHGPSEEDFKQLVIRWISSRADLFL
ncbi:MAG: hypothetical protein D6808_02940 [Candidatus Dadabacteria bacterium]|nr:MAG: hypothetical protein D6808_02940 [Candidatus Dadabacteria bacterium]